MKSDHNGKGKGHTTEKPDVSHRRSAEVAREMSDVNIRGILMFIVGLMVMTIAVYLLMWGMFRVLFTQEQGKESQSPPSPMAMTGKEKLPPEPRLQSAPGFAEGLEKEAGAKPTPEASPTPRDPVWEIKVLREHWQAELKDGVKDQSGKVVVTPIEEAKKQLLKQGLPTRSLSESLERNGEFTFAIDTPTAASSGRVPSKPSDENKQVKSP